MKSRGFTLVEVMVAAAIALVACGSVLALAMTGQRMYVTSSNSVKSSSRAHALMERLLVELRQASIHGEDVDDDNDPSDLAQEDTNGNGVIDDDWSLPDGATAQSLTANLSLGQGIVSDPVTFRYASGKLLRIQGGASPRTDILANDVSALTFTRRGRRLVIHLVVWAGAAAEKSTGFDRGGKTISLVREVLLRN